MNRAVALWVALFLMVLIAQLCVWGLGMAGVRGYT